VQEVLNRIQQIPGVQQAAMASGGPFGGGMTIGHYPGSEGTGMFLEGVPENKLQINDCIYSNDVTPDYFAALGIPILKGRNFEPGNTRAAIVSESFARKYFPGNPLGKRFNVYRNQPLLEIIGVVNDTRNRSVLPQRCPTYYYPHAGVSSFGISVIVRTSTDPVPFLPAITRAIYSVDKDASITETKTVDQILADSAAEATFQTALLGAFGALGLILAIIGIYGVISYSVVQQTHEIGIRMALGAQRGRILRMILQKGMLLAASGAAIGIAGALALTRVLQAMLYEIKPTDPGTFAGVAILLILAALAACYIPARQAANSDPMTALRNE
jgi:putative ABC transport system permease protein